MYVITARARFECPLVLVVVTPDATPARWAAQTVELSGSWFWAPLVVGPEGIPIIADVERARREPELAVLSVMAHGRGEPSTSSPSPAKLIIFISRPHPSTFDVPAPALKSAAMRMRDVHA